MPAKFPLIISSILSVVILLVVGAGVFLIAVVALNGFNSRQGEAALTVFALCGGIGVIVSAMLTGRLTKYFITKYNWNGFWAAIVSMLVSVMAGVIFYGIAFILSLVVAQALFYS